MAHLSHPAAALDQRAWLRTPTALRAKIFPGGFDCMIRDFNRRGARSCFLGPPPPDRSGLVVIWSTGMAHEAVWCWSTANEAGCRFEAQFNLRKTVPERWMEARSQWLERRPKLRRNALRAAGAMIDYRGSPGAVRVS